MAVIKKIDLIKCAYSQLRISGLTVLPDAADISLALDRLEAMMAFWRSQNICTDYNFTHKPDPNDLSNVELEEKLAIETNLAKELYSDFGKDMGGLAPSPTLLARAAATLQALYGTSAIKLLDQNQYPRRMPIGSGNEQKYYKNWLRFYRESPNAPSECDTNKLRVDDIDDYVESWQAYLNLNEVIDSYTIEADDGLTLISDSLSSPFIQYRIQADSQQTSGEWQQVKITITTDTGRVNTRLVNFEVQPSNTIGSNP